MLQFLVLHYLFRQMMGLQYDHSPHHMQESDDLGISLWQ